MLKKCVQAVFSSLIASEGLEVVKEFRSTLNFLIFLDFRAVVINEAKGLIILQVSLVSGRDMTVIVSGLSSIYSKHSHVTPAKYVCPGPGMNVRRGFCFCSSCLASVY